jgi:hypothetical protein
VNRSSTLDSDGVSASTLFTVEPSSGHLTSLGSLPVASYAIASRPCVACPTPYEMRYGDRGVTRCPDLDGDGFWPAGRDCGPIDCDDTDPGVHPGAVDACNGRDDDCNGTIDSEPQASMSCGSSCTVEGLCVTGVCTTRPRTGFATALCELDELSPDSLCDGQLPSRWRAIIFAVVHRVRAPIVLAQERASHSSKPRLVRHPLNIASRRLSVLIRRVMRASRYAGSPASTCLASIGSEADDVRRVIAEMAP